MDTLDLGLLILRVGVGLVFAAHGAQKAFGWWQGPGPEKWLGAVERMGFRPAGLFALISVGVELVGGVLLALGLFTPLAAAALVAQSVVIIGHAHWTKGFFNTNGGYEFPLVLGVGVTALVLVGAGAWSADSVIGFSLDSVVRFWLLVAGPVAGGIALAIPRLAVQRAPSHA